jgi:hypothetical protein
MTSVSSFSSESEKQRAIIDCNREIEESRKNRDKYNKDQDTSAAKTETESIEKLEKQKRDLQMANVKLPEKSTTPDHVGNKLDVTSKS